MLLAALATPAAAQHALATGGPYDPSVPTPNSVLGYGLGERFTPHHLLMRYVERLAAASPRLHVDTVARSFEGREVLLVTVTGDANRERLDQIRTDAARLADPRGASAGDLSTVAARTPAIVWLGFTVHGPEASGAEAALGLLYQLAAGQDEATRMLLDSLVILIDPLQNPDGHERHAQDVMRMRTALGVPTHPAARIHTGTWPGPRTSHYYFDLNRDWYVQSHPETRGRIASMLRWWPHVAVDLHEMGYNSTYFFPPTMEPVNQLVTPGILEWWDTFAGGTIEMFDRHGWAFFRREGYDEFYPGYGSSWPIYSGAIGMTYEQASSRGGAIRRDDGTILTLEEAARHHYGAAWATLLTAARHADALVRHYLDFRRSAIADGARAPFRAVVLARDAQGRADSLARKLIENGIEVRQLRATATARDAWDYGPVRTGAPRFDAGDYVVDFAQPQGRLARVLLDPDAPLDSAFIADELERRRTGMDERFYDVTAWSLPYTFRVDAWGVRTLPGPLAEVSFPPAAAPVPPARFGYAFAPGSESSLRLLAQLLADSVRVVFAPRAFRAGGASFPLGAFVVRVAGNDSTVHERVRTHATGAGATVTGLTSAGVDEGTDLGSNSVFPIRPVRVALLGAEPVSGYSFGSTWFALDQRLRYPSTWITAEGVLGGALDDFDVLIIPSVSPSAFERVLGDGGKERLAGWVRRGGTLITVEGATEWLASERSGLSRVRPLEIDGDTATAAPLPASVPGAIVRALVDTLSPLLAGIGARELPVLVFTDAIFATPKDVEPGELVIRHAPERELRLSGYLWPEVPARLGGTPYLWTEEHGSGRVIAFTGNPTFRDAWRGLLPLFANAVFIGPSM